MTNGLILASASVARARLFEAAGLDIRIEPAGIDERAIKQTYRAEGGEAPRCALALAEAKARRVAGRDNRFLVIGADQILICGDVWFDKPSGSDEARAQLQALRGRTHELVTAASAVQDETLLWHAVSRPR